ncbi:cytochrome P450 4V2-like [Sitophilus oryzae]|uniref:Cytochrome P450 4V2-like n=1 Tax=Sitophilus oryzae TaxID=7048 RepID=A0A6J2XUL5_SITOR|nr:cytochrome P450 4V2-like [Sitophilus oryzae]
MVWIKFVFGLGLVFILILLWTAWSLYSKRRIFKFAENYKNSYTFYPIVGNSLSLKNTDMFELFVNKGYKNGLPTGCWLGHNYYYLPDDTEEMKLVLTNQDCLDKADFYKVVKLCIWTSILLLPGNLWKPKRKYLAKSFSLTTLNSFVPIFYKNSQTLIQRLKNMGNKDIFEVCVGYAFNAFLETMTNKNYNLQTEEGAKVIRHIDLCQEIAGEHFVNGTSGNLFYFFCIWTNIIQGFRLYTCVILYRIFIQQVVAEKEKEIKENSLEDTNKILLNSIINADKNLYSRYAINDEFATFAFAAADTSGTALAFLLTLLGMHVNIQDKVYEEILKEIGLDRLIEVQDLPKLKYLERVIFETLRLFPIAPAIGRHATKDIECGTKTIPKGINIVISIFTLHRDERFWTDPLKFNPDRFLPEEVAKRPSFCYIPFSTGPRNCIGRTYAMMSLKVVAANVIRHYKMFSNYKSVDEINLRSFVTMRARHNLDCKFTPR